MFLIEENDKNIRVYNYLINATKMYNFKKENMAKINENERILQAITNYCYYPLEEKEKIIRYNEVNYEIHKNLGNQSFFHILCPYNITDDEIVRQRKILESYYYFLGTYESAYQMLNSKFKENDITSERLLKLNHNSLTINDDGLYLIPTTTYVYAGNDLMVMKDILNVPEILFYLEQFLASDYRDIPDEYILEFMKLIDKKETKDIDIDTINMMVKYQLINRNNLDKKLNDSAKTLKLIKNN